MFPGTEQNKCDIQTKSPFFNKIEIPQEPTPGRDDGYKIWNEIKEATKIKEEFDHLKKENHRLVEDFLFVREKGSTKETRKVFDLSPV